MVQVREQASEVAPDVVARGKLAGALDESQRRGRVVLPVLEQLGASDQGQGRDVIIGRLGHGFQRRGSGRAIPEQSQILGVRQLVLPHTFPSGASALECADEPGARRRSVADPQEAPAQGAGTIQLWAGER